MYNIYTYQYIWYFPERSFNEIFGDSDDGNFEGFAFEDAQVKIVSKIVKVKILQFL